MIKKLIISLFAISMFHCSSDHKPGYFTKTNYDGSLSFYYSKEGEITPVEFEKIMFGKFETWTPKSWVLKIFNDSTMVFVDTNDSLGDNISIVKTSIKECGDSVVFNLKRNSLKSSPNTKLLDYENLLYTNNGETFYLQNSLLGRNDKRYSQDCYFTCLDNNSLISCCLTYSEIDTFSKRAILDYLSERFFQL